MLFRSGDKTPLKYRLFDADGENLNIAGKSAKVRLVYPDFLTIGYEKDVLTVAQDDTVTFTIDSVIPSRIYHVEIIVDDKFIFPSRADESKFTVDKSSLGTETNIIEIVGKDVLIREVKSQVDTELQPLVTSLESAQQSEIQRVEAEQERVQGYQEIRQIIEDGALSAVPADGSVTTGKLADASVTTAKLDNAFGSRGDLSAGTDLKTLVNQGVYFGQPNGNYLNAPTGFATNRYFELSVDVLSQSWAIQKFVDFTTPSNVWHKTIHRTNFSVNNAWEFVGTPSNASVDRIKLSNNFSSSGTLTSGTDLDKIVKEGVYLGISTNSYTNMPSGTTGQSFVLKVQVGGAVNSFITQELIILGDSSKFYKRLNTNADNPDVWSEFNVASSGGSGVTPSYFSDKTILMFGDSITENGDYPERVGNYLGGATIKKAGFGGCRMGQHTQSGNGLHYDKMCMYRLVDYIESGDFSELITASEDMVRANGDDNRPQSHMLAELDFSKIDIITIFFGTNDFGAADGVPIGANDDTDGTTFKGAINKVIQKLSTVLPKAKLMFITPFYRNRLVTVGDGLNSDDEPNTRGVYLQEYVDAIKEICEIHHVPCLDLMAESGINRYNQHVYLSDGLHPSSPNGYEHVARKVVSGLISNF